MAKWGDGDPRWIVEERTDATNVNNWHWTEKNATGWSKDKLKELLGGLTIEDKVGTVELKEFSTLEGEATINNRKQKLIFFYEWDLKLKWTGLMNTDDEYNSCEGTLEIPNLSDEQDISDIEVNVMLKKSKCAQADVLKEMLRTKGAGIIREKLTLYLASLKQEFSRGVILPTVRAIPAVPAQSSTPPQKSTPPPSVKLAQDFKQTSINGPNTGPDKNVGVKLSTKKISMKEEFMCSKEQLYDILTQKDLVQSFSRETIKTYQLEKGGKFSIFDGKITGEFLELMKPDTIKLHWAFKGWPDGHFSTVTIKLSQASNCCILTLSQTGVPADWADRTREGWTNYYWNSIRMRFGLAVNMF